MEKPISLDGIRMHVVSTADIQLVKLGGRPMAGYSWPSISNGTRVKVQEPTSMKRWASNAHEQALSLTFGSRGDSDDRRDCTQVWAASRIYGIGN